MRSDKTTPARNRLLRIPCTARLRHRYPFPCHPERSRPPSAAQSRDLHLSLRPGVTIFGLSSRGRSGRGICFSDNRQLVTDNQFVIPTGAALRWRRSRGPAFVAAFECHYLRFVITRPPRRPRDLLSSQPQRFSHFLVIPTGAVASTAQRRDLHFSPACSPVDPQLPLPYF
jgi:hypothetical protein